MEAAIVFDMSETLLDPKAMHPAFESDSGLGNFRKEGFNELLMLAFVSAIVGTYVDFGIMASPGLGRSRAGGKK